MLPNHLSSSQFGQHLAEEGRASYFAYQILGCGLIFSLPPIINCYENSVYPELLSSYEASWSGSLYYLPQYVFNYIFNIAVFCFPSEPNFPEGPEYEKYQHFFDIRGEVSSTPRSKMTAVATSE